MPLKALGPLLGSFLLGIAVLATLQFFHLSEFHGYTRSASSQIDEEESVPFIATSDKQQQQEQQLSSPLCRPRLPAKGTVIRRIYFAHMRKAGGTTLHHYLTRVADELGLTLDVGEGEIFEVPGTRNDTLYVTHIRDPVKRLISNFEYEGRWGWNCKWLETVVPEAGEDMETLTKMLSEKERSDSLDYFLRRDKAINSTSCERKHLYYWCSQNCFSRWLALPTHVCPEVPFEQVARLAKERAMRQHIIVLLEFMKDEAYVQNLEKFFGVQGYSHSSKDLYCFNETKLANRLVPRLYTNETLELFHKFNWGDYELLDHLTEDCPSSKHTVFPEYNLRNLILP